MTDNTWHGVASAGYSITINVKIENKVGQFSRFVQVAAENEGLIAEVDLIYSDSKYNIRNVTINCPSQAQAQKVLAEVSKLGNVEVYGHTDDTFEVHKGGKLVINGKTEPKTADQLARVYTPGVGRVCTAIHEKPELVYDYTIKSSTVAVITDGSAVLGLGNIGAEASLPVMEGKAVLFKQFGGLNAFPICLNTQDVDQIVDTVEKIAPVFGGINLEDISAPRCFEVEQKLRERLDIPVFHDDQHGTAVVVLAGLLNATKFLNKRMEDLKVVVNGFGASGLACTKMLLMAGVKNIISCDSKGAIYRGRSDGMNPFKEEVLEQINPDNLKGQLEDVIKGADMFLGLSKPGMLNREMVLTMAKNPIVFALANPIPEIAPEEIQDIAGVIATGRSDYPNQVNNVLCFPGLMKGAIACRASDITEGMKMAASMAIANSISQKELSADNIIPAVFTPNIADKVAESVRQAAIKDGVARI